MRWRFAILVLAALLAGCTAGDESGSDTTAAPSDDTTAEGVPTGPAPGVTDDSVKVGVQYVDLDSLGDIVTIEHGDYEAAYNALFDDINAAGGVHGRTIEPVFAPINPVGTDAADAACVELTEDEAVFAVVGFFLGDTVLCPLENHQTAVIGGPMTDERLARAEAPWFTAEAGSDQQTEVITTFAEEGEFDGTLGVFAIPADEALLNEVVLPLLEELGVEVAASAVNDAPQTDITAGNNATAVIAQRFETAGVDQVLNVGQAGLVWASGTESLEYRPQLLFTDPNSILAYTGDAAGRDLSLLDGAVTGGLYGRAQNIYELPGMQDCIGIIEDAGVDVPSPDSLTGNGDDLFVASFTACQNVALLRSLLEAAGEDLNYGSFVAGADGLEVDIPSQPEPLVYGPPPAADGDVPVYLFDWDTAEGDFVLRED